MGWRRPDPTARHVDWTSEASSALALAGFLFLVFWGFTMLAAGPLISLDAYFNLQPPPEGWLPVLHVLDRVGQRAVCLPVLAAVALVCARRARSWRPLWMSGIAVLALNLVVLALKVGLGRGQPGAVNPSFFVGGMAYPSGHTANIVLVYGLAAYLLGRHRVVGRRWQVASWALVAVLAVTMVTTSLTLNWHWFADLVAGLLVGAAVLEAVVAVDAAAPVGLLDAGPMATVRSVGGLLARTADGTRRRRPRRTRRPAAIAPAAQRPPVEPPAPAPAPSPAPAPGIPEAPAAAATTAESVGPDAPRVL